MTIVRRAIDLMKVEEGQIVLDLGCGDGSYSRQVNRKRPGKLMNLDISYQSLRNLKQTTEKSASYSAINGNIYACGDALNLPFFTHSFDHVICSLVFYLVPLQPALKELHRVLKPEGTAFLRLPMLAWGRVIDVVHQMPDLRRVLYCTNELLNGFFFALVGKQVFNPLLRSDHWACYIPLRRFRIAVCRAGLQIRELRIDYSRPGIPSIEALVRKPSNDMIPGSLG